MPQRLPENLPQRPRASTSAAGRHKLCTVQAGAARSRLVLVQHRGSEKACLTQGLSHIRFNYHYPLVPYLRTILQGPDWTYHRSHSHRSSI
ncbi:hypothetical protein RRG08_040274 [Elysia crispata]|uniref:Uncharacterized protein n=1 Tax=Elysia crispata TaxID=231223 RepID=A0AAE0YBY5_9GAST|nr:hypothetical protein RRG08_040274 [Elysia crispata]